MTTPTWNGTGGGGVAVRVSGPRKSYGGRLAVDGLDLDISAGEVFALLGPNSAGKTTTVEILEGYRRRDAGEVVVERSGGGPVYADVPLDAARRGLTGRYEVTIQASCRPR